MRTVVSIVCKWVGVQDWQVPHLEGGSKIITREAENRREVAGERIWCTGEEGRGSYRVFVYDFVTSPISCTPGWPGPY